MKRIYIAGKLNDIDAVKYLHNCHVMMQHAQKVKDAGFAIFVPCIDLMMGLKFGYKNYHDYFDNSQPWLDVADAIYVCPNYETSSGTIKEIGRARDRNIPIFYNIEDLIEYFKNG